MRGSLSTACSSKVGAFPTAAWARPFAAAAAAGANPKVFFDCAIGGAPAGRIVFELYADVVPKVLSSTPIQSILSISIPALS